MAAAAAQPDAKELQRRLDQALREKEELVRDLEQLCLADSSTTFNTSSVLQERILVAGGCWVLGAALPPPFCLTILAALRAPAAGRTLTPLPQPRPCCPPPESELARDRAQLAAVSAQRDGLREDLSEVTEAKRRAEQGFKAQLERAAALDRELAFYQAQSARVMGDRDRALCEGEELKAANLKVRWEGGCRGERGGDG